MAPRSGRSTVPRERTQFLPLSSLSQHHALLCWLNWPPVPPWHGTSSRPHESTTTATAPPCSHWPEERSHTVPICVKVCPSSADRYAHMVVLLSAWARTQTMMSSPAGSRAIAGAWTFRSPGAMSTSMRSPPQVSPWSAEVLAWIRQRARSCPGSAVASYLCHSTSSSPLLSSTTLAVSLRGFAGPDFEIVE